MLRLFQLTHHPHYIHIHNYFQKTNMVYKNVAVIGAGGIGAPIAKVSAYSILDKQLTEKRDFTPVKALVSEGANVIVVARPESSSTKDLPSSIKVVSVELTDVAALASTFKEHNIEVVVSAVATVALVNQTHIADAAKEAGVKLFVPSEFGYSTIGQTEGALGLKDKLAAHLKEIGLPYARVFVSINLLDQLFQYKLTNNHASGWSVHNLHSLVAPLGFGQNPNSRQRR